MTKYKIGDKVKIREDLKGGCEYNELYFNTDMEKYRGKIATITEVTNVGDYSIDLDCNYWWWNDYMFEYAILTEKQFDRISELEKQIAELKEQLEKKSDGKMSVKEKIWKPEENEIYDFYNIYTDCCYEEINNCTNFDIRIINSGVAYLTKEKAEFEANREKYTRLFRQYVEQHSEPLDWHNVEQFKYSVGYDHDKNEVFFVSCLFSQRAFSIYASSVQVLKEAIDFIGEDNVKKYIFEVV